MKLPIYQENLRSSGDWRTGLHLVREQWQKVKTDPDVQTQIRERQSQGFDSDIYTAAKLVSEWAEQPEKNLEVARLIELNRALSQGDGGFREASAELLSDAHDPPLAQLIPRLLENAMGWFATEGVAEMNAVEQAALVHLRLLDLQPFATANHATASLAASFYVERAGLPPLIFSFADERYVAALESAFRLLTQHLVDYFAESLTHTIATLQTEIEN